MIVSRQNRKLKDIRRLRRCKGDRALLEGPHLIAEARALDLELELVLATPEYLSSSEARALVDDLPQAPLEVAPALLSELSDADAPRGLLAIVRLPRGGVEELPRLSEGLYLYLDGLQDPGNLGALARVAEAAGAAGLALASGCVHPNHPRALRASAGSLLRLPVARAVAVRELQDHLAEQAPKWIALQPRGGVPLWQADLSGAVVLAVGAEGPGLSAEVAAHCDRPVTIPLSPPVESLNSVVAAALVLFEISRRSRHAG